MNKNESDNVLSPFLIVEISGLTTKSPEEKIESEMTISVEVTIKNTAKGTNPNSRLRVVH